MAAFSKHSPHNVPDSDKHWSLQYEVDTSNTGLIGPP